MKGERTYAVLTATQAGLEQTVSGLKDKQDCLKWIKANGQPGEQYWPIAFLGDPVAVEVENVEKRRLVPVQEVTDEQRGA